MATKKTASADTMVEVFVLCDCFYGKCGEVVTVTAAEAENGVLMGVLDVNPAAVSNAKG